jgi:hypothetical protein
MRSSGSGGPMKLLDNLQSLRANLLQIEMAFHESGQLSVFRLAIGVPIAIAILLIEIIGRLLR